MTQEPSKGWSIYLEKQARTRVLWICALGICFLVSVYAAFRGGYVGPDYDTHLARILHSKRFFDFSMPDPPIYIILAHGLFRLIGRNNGFPITLSIIQVAVNILALWWFFLYSEQRFKSPLLHLAFVLLLIFLPVRVTHVATSGTDWMTIPVFVLLLFLFDKFRSDETSTPKNAAFVGLALALGIWCKYSFMALIAALFVIFALLWWRRRWGIKRFVSICALGLLLPSALLIYSYWASTRVKNAISQTLWIPKGGISGQPELDWKDLLLIKAKDIQLFSAPQFFKPPKSDPYPFGYREPHRHSFLALSHMGTFTDTENLFQDLAPVQNIEHRLTPDLKTRRPWKTPVMIASMSLGVLWTLLALIGTPWILVRAVRHLWEDKLEREDIAIPLGIAFFLLMFLLVPFTMGAAITASWTPRLYLVPLLCFFWAGFLLIDRTIVAKWEKVAVIVLGLAIVQSGLALVMLTNVNVFESPVTAFEGGQGSGKGQFYNPRALAVDPVGNIFVADSGNGRIEKFSPSGTFLTSIATRDPNGIAFDHAGNIYVAEIGSKHRVQKLGPDGKFIAEWAPGLYGPRKIAIGPDDSVYVVDSGHNRIVKFSRDGQVLASWGSEGSGDGQFKALSSVAIDAINNKVYVADPVNSRIQVFDSNGKFLSKWSVPEWREALGFEDLAIEPDRGRLYASSAYMNTILVFDLHGNRLGTLTPTPPDKLDAPSAVVLAKDKLFVLSAGSAHVSLIPLQDR